MYTHTFLTATECGLSPMLNSLYMQRFDNEDIDV